jgi:hypothetical protein
VVLGLLALWYRQQSYLACQWIRPYPDHGLIYIAIQIVAPALVVAVGAALTANRFV